MPSPKRQSLATLAFLCLFTASSTGQEAAVPRATWPEIDALCEPWSADGSPGLSLAVVQNGVLIYTRNCGLANLEHGVPLTNATAFNLASLTKQFVGYAVLLLEKEGRLSLDDPLKKYLPDLQLAEDVRLRHLLHHTSGLREHWAVWRLSVFKGDTLDDIVALQTSQRHTNFTPGAHFAYTNSNYVLLSRVVEIVSGESLSTFCRKNIFAPLNMNGTHFLDSPGRLIPGRATTYVVDGDGWKRHIYKGSDILGDGGLYSTIDDLLKWDRELYKSLQGAAFSRRRRQVGRLDSGETIHYAVGLQRYERGGLLSLEHGGGTPGASTFLAQYPEIDGTIIVLANTDRIDAGAVAAQIREIAFPRDRPGDDAHADGTGSIGGDPAGRKPETDGADSTREVKLDSFAGFYAGTANDQAGLYEIKVGDGHLLGGQPGGSPRTHMPVGSGRFESPGIPGLVLEIDATRRLEFIYNGQSLGSFVRLADGVATREVLIAGRYTSSEVGRGVWKVETVGAEVRCETPRGATSSLQKLAPGVYRAGDLNVVLAFSGQDGEQATGVLVFAPGVVGLEMVRLPSTPMSMRN